MKKKLSIIGLTLAGFLNSIAPAQNIPLTFNPAQSSVSIELDGSSSSSALSGTAAIDIQSLGPPSGNAQITQLNFVADDGLNYSFGFGLVSLSTTPGDVSIFMETPGAPGTLSGTSFNQLSNTIALGGDFNVSDPSNLAGGNQTIDLSTLTLNPLDFDSVNVTQSGNNITISSSFTINETLDLGAGPILMVADITFVATCVAPAVLLGDVDLDGAVTFFDIAPFIAILSASGFKAEADCDESGEVNFLDIAPFIEILSS